MSTKNLSRTIIEGGRASTNKDDRRAYHRETREQTRRLRRLLLLDPSAADDGPSTSTPIRPEHADKLRPLFRWLASRNGEPWDRVYSDLRYRFDVRNLRSAHLLEHVTNAVARRGYVGSYYRGFRVDDDGILRVIPPSYTRPKREVPRLSSAKVLAWTRHRVVHDYGAVRFWLMPNSVAWSPCTAYRCASPDHRKIQKREYIAFPDGFEKKFGSVRVESDGFGGLRYYRIVTRCTHLQAYGPFRQGRRFDAHDDEQWDMLTGAQQRSLQLAQPTLIP